MEHYVYQLVDHQGTPFYIGATSLEGRARGHASRARQGHPAPVYGRIRELDQEFELQKLIEGVDRETAAWWETYLIDITPGLCNVRRGGDGGIPGWNQSPDARKKIAAANRGLKKDAETRAKISAKARDRKHSPERLAKFSEVVACPHCDVVGGRNGMQRWHFDRCRAARR